MGMQVNPYSAGSVVPSRQELPQEKPPPLFGEKLSAEQIEASLPASQKPPAPDLKQVSAELEHISLAFNRRLKFEINDDSGEILIKVIDNETDKVIKVLPPEELQRLHSRIRESFGFLFDAMV